MIYIVKINNKEYEVEVEKGQANLINTTEIINIPAVTAAPIEAPQAVTTISKPSAVVGSGEAVKAPMPGTILSINVDTGSTVKKGQLLFVLEAMKMENEIFSPCDGTVGQILVSKGSSVATNENLMIIQ